MGYYVANGKPVESPTGEEKGLAVVIIRPDGKPTNPVPVRMLSKKTKQILFGKTSNAKPDFLEKGLLGYYKLDGASTQNDVSEEKNPWIVSVGQPVFDRFGNPNGATTCGEGNGYLPLSHGDPAKYALREFTISIWFKWKNDHPHDVYRALIARGGQGDWSVHNYQLHISNLRGENGKFGNGILQAGSIGGKGKEERLTSSTVVADGKWHHVAFVFNEKLSSACLYIDGKKEDQQEVKDVRVFANLVTTLGVWMNSRNGYGHFNGDLDDLRIYKKPLTDAEVKKLYEYESKPPAIEKPSK
ncbi:LamG domain-containing protein [Pirellulaceae bacterium]|nr:LamG domain-containing protein [Pirellulaceae bacterium]